MSDLISRSEAVQRLIKETVDSKNNLIHINTVKRLLQDVDTSYDIDKVVDELKKSSKWVNETNEYCDDDGNDYIPLSKAIEIVKQGFVGTETGIEAETIRDKAVKWNNRSTKKVPYEFIEFVEGKRTIDAEDDVCEWMLCDEESNVYDTSCRNPHILIEGTPRENNYKYFPYCGKKIKEAE